MPNYEVTMQRTLSASLSVGCLTAATATLRRFKVYSMTFSSEATPAEVAVLWVAGRITAAGTSTAVTPKPKDLADAATGTVGGQNHTIEATYTAGETMYSNAVHQRATVRWIARDDQDMIVCPATNAAGLGVKTPTLNGGTPVGTLDIGYID
jgi:hypothetical protein